MEQSKKFGKSSFAKHLRNKKGKWTKQMANSKSRLNYKRDLKLERLVPFNEDKVSG